MQKFLWLGTQCFTAGFTPTERVAETKRELCLLPIHHAKPWNSSFECCLERLEFGQSNIARAVLDDVSAHLEQWSDALSCAKYRRYLECALEVVFMLQDPRLLPQEVD